jgi:hypothetical protein
MKRMQAMLELTDGPTLSEGGAFLLVSGDELKNTPVPSLTRSKKISYFEPANKI